MTEEPAGEARNPKGVRVVLPTALWQNKILQDIRRSWHRISLMCWAIAELIALVTIREPV